MAFDIREIQESYRTELRDMNYIKSHSRHVSTSTLVFAPNDTVNQERVRVQEQPQEQGGGA